MVIHMRIYYLNVGCSSIRVVFNFKTDNGRVHSRKKCFKNHRARFIIGWADAERSFCLRFVFLTTNFKLDLISFNYRKIIGDYYHVGTLCFHHLFWSKSRKNAKTQLRLTLWFWSITYDTLWHHVWRRWTRPLFWLAILDLFL